MFISVKNLSPSLALCALGSILHAGLQLGEKSLSEVIIDVCLG